MPLVFATNATSAQPTSEMGTVLEPADTESAMEDKELDGGPCRGRTYGPLIKSESWGIAQVIDDVSNPLVIPTEELPSPFSSFRITSPVSRHPCTTS
jgi:hypothetical protein